MELAAAFEYEVHECPPPMRLRDYWARLNVLGAGVLRPPSAVFRPTQASKTSQGVRELVALSGVCEAFRRISGNFEKSDSQIEDAVSELKAELASDANGKSLIPALASLVTGGLIGGGLAIHGEGPAAATGAGLAATLGSALLLKWSISRSHSRALKREYRFFFDTSIATLDRVLPVLLERLLDAGLAPIFVVDELDKVDDLSDRIFGMVRHLKKLVAESAFFCFLTDRSYFEEMRRRGERRAYPIEYSYFTHRLFVTYRADDFHVYLGRLLNEPIPTPAATSPQDAGRVSPAVSVPVEYPLLRYFLLRRSEMHALELHRLVTSLRDEKGTLTLSSNDLRTRMMYRIDVALQLGIEIVLDDDDLQDRIRGEPEFQRLVHDALLYPVRQWREGALDIDLDDARITDFRAHLLGRMNRSEASGSIARFNAPKVERWARADIADAIDRKDMETLWHKVRDYVRLLSPDGELEARFNLWNARRVSAGRVPVDRAVLDHLEIAADTLPFRRRDPGSGLVYDWRFDRYAVNRFPPPPPVVPQPSPAAAPSKHPRELDIELIEAFADSLSALAAV
jgi:hypothetical protein